MIIDSPGFTKRTAFIFRISLTRSQCQTWLWHLCWFYKRLHSGPVKPHCRHLPARPGAMRLSPPPPSDSHSCQCIRKSSPSYGCFRLAPCSCRNAKQPHQHSVQLPNRPRKRWLDLADCGDCHFLFSFGSMMIYAACVQMRMSSPLFLTHTLSLLSLSFLSALNPRSLFLHMLISHLFLHTRMGSLIQNPQ